MTTNVYCATGGLLASDSRWSFDQDKEYAVLYVDDTGFDKIEVLDTFSGTFGFLFAGSSLLIQHWKNWIHGSPSSFQDMPPLDKGISVCIVNKQTRAFKQWHGFAWQTEAYFAGTGYTHALMCWSTNKDAKRAVESAKQRDSSSGGKTLYFELNSGSNNLNKYSAHCSIDIIREAALKRGTVMYRNEESVHVPIADASASDPRIKELCDKIANGQLHASAPCPGTLNEWTDADKESLKDELAEIFSISR